MRWDWRGLPGLLGGATRWSDWSGTKVSLLLVPFFYQALLADPRGGRGMPLAPAELVERFGVIFVSICLGYAFGYAANDVADREADLRAGKPNVLGRLPPAVGGALLVGLAAAGIAAVRPFYHQPLVLELVIASYVVGALYSLPPVRFKERGWLGLLVSAAAQRSLPALIVYAILGALGWEAALYAGLMLLVGLRWILVHQLLDLGADRRAGVRTYVAQRGRERAQRLLRRLVFPLEVAALGAVLATMAWRLPAFGPLLLPYGLWMAFRLASWRGVGSDLSLEGYDRQPLADFYCLYWPLSLLLLLTIQQPALWPLGAVFVLWQARFFVLAAVTLQRLLRARGLWAWSWPREVRR